MKTRRLITAISLSISVWMAINMLCNTPVANAQEAQAFSLCENQKTTENFNFCPSQAKQEICDGHCSSNVTTSQTCKYAATLKSCLPAFGTSRVQVYQADCVFTAGAGAGGCRCPSGMYPYHGSYTNPDDNSCNP